MLGWVGVAVEWCVVVGLFLGVSVAVLWGIGRVLPLVGGRHRRKG
jgi:hypothetical protein